MSVYKEYLYSSGVGTFFKVRFLCFYSVYYLNLIAFNKIRHYVTIIPC